MSIQIFPKASAAKADINAKVLLEHFQEHEEALGLDHAIIFYNFPLFREDDHLLVADLVLASPFHGVVLLSTVDSLKLEESGAEVSTRLEGAFSQVFSRLVRYPRLRSGRASLLFEIDAFIWAKEGPAAAEVRVGLGAIDDFLKGARRPEPLSE